MAKGLAISTNREQTLESFFGTGQGTDSIDQSQTRKKPIKINPDEGIPYDTHTELFGMPTDNA